MSLSIQKNQRNKKRNFRSPLLETFLSIKTKVGMFTKLMEYASFDLLFQQYFLLP